MFVFLILLQHCSYRRIKTIADDFTLGCLTGMSEIFSLNEMQVPGISRALKTADFERVEGIVHQLSELNVPGNGKLDLLPDVAAIQVPLKFQDCLTSIRSFFNLNFASSFL